MECGVSSAECSVRCGIHRVKCEVWTVSVKCGVYGVKCGVYSVEEECKVWNVKCKA